MARQIQTRLAGVETRRHMSSAGYMTRWRYKYPAQLNELTRNDPYGKGRPMEFHLPQRPWHDRWWTEIDMPDDWDVRYCPMAGHDRAPMSTEEMAACIDRPIGTISLRESAGDKKEAATMQYFGQQDEL